MPILRLNADHDGLRLHGSLAPALPAVQAAARGTGPIIVMIHGFKYDPADPQHSPHAAIFALTPPRDRKTLVLWPRHLGFGSDCPTEGLCIAFGWPARGTPWRAHRAARAAGGHLGRVVHEIKAVAPHRPVHILSHSMGSEVALAALEAGPDRGVARVIALTGASHVNRAARVLAGRETEFINVMSRENDLFDFIYEQLIVPDKAGDRALGVGIFAPNAVNIQIDCPHSLRALSAIAGPLGGAKRRICHWSGYTRPGAMALYADLMRRPAHLPISMLQQILPRNNAPRWSRLALRGPSSQSPLPNLQNIA